MGICMMLVANIRLSASPAYPNPIQFIQPDGSKISILLKGDEKVKWAQTLDGYTIMFNDRRTYEYAVLNSSNDMIPSGVKANSPENRSMEEQNFLTTVAKGLYYSSSQIQMLKQAWGVFSTQQQLSFPTTGTRKLICILMGFTDKAFTKTQTDFNNLFNQIGYSTGGATGSVKDYYSENSYGQLNLAVTVAGPYTAAHNMAYYGGNNANGQDQNPDELVSEAVTLANSSVNYADFDNDNNGIVDGVYVIYAGYGEEAGASANTIWAHAWSITPVVYDGKTISSYSCSSELSGTSGSTITSIGVICHEFGHVMGAPDYYDTDYSTSNEYDGTGEWDIMASGSWNNSGITPAHHNAYTKVYVYNWATATTLSTGATVTLNNAEDYSNSFYRYNTNTAHEYFLLENRQKTKFDASLPGKGMIIYHVDSSFIASNTSANTINTTSHQGMFIKAANATTSNGVMTSSASTINSTGCPFPGTSSKTSFTDATTPNAKSWAGTLTAKPITAITENTTAKTVTFNFMGGSSCTPPTTQASAFTSGTITGTAMTIGWTRGDGNGVIVVAKQASAINSSPVNGITYTANAVFGSGTQIGTGNYVVYKGTGTSVNVTGLTSGVTYYFAVYEYTSSTNCYLTPALTGNASTSVVPSLSVTPSSQNVAFNAGNTTFAVTSNVTWAVSSNQTWCTVTPSGSGSGVITATYTANTVTTPRTATITVSATGVTSVVLSVVQSGMGTAVWPQSFEAIGFPPYGWSEQNPIGGNGWDSIVAGTTPIPGWSSGVVTACPGGGNKMAIANYTSGTSTSTNQWLISAPKVISSTDKLKFWMRKVEQYADTMYIKLSNTSNAIANFTTNIATLAFAPADTGWVSYSYDLSMYAGQTIYVAFQEKIADVNTNGATLFLDLIDILCSNPSAAGVISGTDTVCQGQTSVTYSVPAIPDATSYIWTLPTGFSGTSTTNSIVLNIDTNAVSGIITVKGVNSCGEGVSSLKNIVIRTKPTVPGTISGLASVCQGQNNVTYSVILISGATSYNWTLPSGFSGTSSSNSITVNFAQTAISGIIQVKGMNSCGYGPSNSKTITVSQLPPAPGPIVGMDSVCQGQTGVNFTVSPLLNVDSYQWIFPSGVTGTGTGNVTNSSFSVTAQSGNIEVKAHNTCGFGASALKYVFVKPLPVMPSVISGSDTVCLGSTGISYSVSNSANTVSYVWSVNNGFTGSSTINSILLDVASNATPAILSVYGVNACGNGSSVTKQLIPIGVPAHPGVISGQGTVCQGSSQTYSVATNINATSFIWLLPAGVAYNTTDTTKNSVALLFNSVSGGTIAVTGKNMCGTGPSATKNIVVNPLPATPVVSLSGFDLCSNALSGNQWYSQSTGVINGATLQTYLPVVNGSYYVIVTQNGCSSQPSNSYAYTIVGVPESELMKNISLYPNPVTNQSVLSYSLTSDNLVEIDLLTLDGKYITSFINQKQASGGYRIPVDVSGLGQGIYLLRIKIGEETHLLKLVK